MTTPANNSEENRPAEYLIDAGNAYRIGADNTLETTPVVSGQVQHEDWYEIGIDPYDIEYCTAMYQALLALRDKNADVQQ